MNIRKNTKEEIEKKNNDKKQRGFSVGTSLVLVTFVLIALVTFGTISYIRAKSDLKLTNEAKEKTDAYYKANTSAEEKLADINNQLWGLREGQIDDESYYESVRLELAAENLIFTEDITGLFASFKEEINENSSIEVKIKINSLDENTVSSIYEWKTVNSKGDLEEDGEEPLHLIF